MSYVLNRGDLHGNGFGDFVRSAAQGLSKANAFLKDNKVISKARGVSDALGLTNLIDAKTGGQFSNLSNKAIQAGYGRKRRKMNGGRKRKMNGGKKNTKDKIIYFKIY